MDGKDYRGSGPIANDGLPNAIVLPVGYTDGIKTASVLYAIRKIKSGEQVLIDYGPKYDGKVDPRVEIAETELLIIFSKEDKQGRSGLKRLRALDKKYQRKGPKVLIENTPRSRLFSILAYIIHTPQAIPLLIRNHLLDANDLLEMSNYAKNGVMGLGDNPANYAQILTNFPLARAFNALEEYDRYLETNFANQFMDIYMNSLPNFFVDPHTHTILSGLSAHSAMASGKIFELVLSGPTPEKLATGLTQFKADLVMDEETAYTIAYSSTLLNEGLRKADYFG